MSRALVTRRSAILDRLAKDGPMTANEIREYLARRSITVAVDTIQRDLRAMERAGTLLCSPHPTQGHTMGQGSWIAYNGWTLIDGKWSG